MNKIKSMNYSTEITNAFLAGQRGKALNAFIGGLNGDASRLLIIRKPAVVHEAYLPRATENGAEEPYVKGASI